MIRIDALWLCNEPQDMRTGADPLMAVVVNTIGEARAHHGYLFANARATRIKLLVHDGFDVWCATRRLHAGRFVWHAREPGSSAPALQLTAQHFEALALGLPWQRLGELGSIREADFVPPVLFPLSAPHHGSAEVRATYSSGETSRRRSHGREALEAPIRARSGRS